MLSRLKCSPGTEAGTSVVLWEGHGPNPARLCLPSSPPSPAPVCLRPGWVQGLNSRGFPRQGLRSCSPWHSLMTTISPCWHLESTFFLGFTAVWGRWVGEHLAFPGQGKLRPCWAPPVLPFPGCSSLLLPSPSAPGRSCSELGRSHRCPRWNGRDNSLQGTGLGPGQGWNPRLESRSSVHSVPGVPG